MGDLLNYIATWLTTFFGVIETTFKFFFNDAPVIFGLRLGWWFILFGLMGLFVDFLNGGGEL